MEIVAGVLAILFGATQGLGAVASLRAPEAERGSGQPGAIPPWARALAAAAAALAVVGGALLVAGVDIAAVALTAAGLAGTCALAIANGYSMKGSPTWSHHFVRISIAVLIVAFAAIGAA